VPKPTLEELLARATSALQRNEVRVHDVAANTGSIVGNVSHMRWFKCAVADDLIATTEKWGHLQPEMNAYRKEKGIT
jgi:type VI protein secretion system component VasF